MMQAPRYHLTLEEEDALLDELLDVLDKVVEVTGCRDMVPLWLIATREPRARNIRSADGPLLVVPPHIRAWAKSQRSKYAALAAWRHTVLAERILDFLDPGPARAVTAMYFTTTDNEPPYSWSKASSRHPKAGEWPSASLFDRRAQQGCRDTVRAIHNRLEAQRQGASAAVEARVDILETGARDGTLRDLLRYEELERGRAS